MDKLIVRNVYQTFQCGTDTSGLGDFLRGCLYINSLSNLYDFKTEINIKCNKQLYALIETNSEWEKPDPDSRLKCIRDGSEVIQLIKDAKRDGLKELNIFTTVYSQWISDDDSKFLLDNFKPKAILDDYIIDYLSKNNLEKYNYEVIQIRLSDLLFTTKTEILSEACINIIKDYFRKNILVKHKYIVIGTYPKLLEKMNFSAEFSNLYSTDINTIHIGKIKEDTTIELVKDTCLEFFLNFYANKITCLNHYYWASNFTKWIAYANKIDYNFIQLYDLIKVIESEYINKLSIESNKINTIKNYDITTYNSYKTKLVDEFGKYNVFKKQDNSTESDMYNNTFQVENYKYQRMLFLDCFIKNNKLILISQIYHDLKVDFSKVKIILKNNDPIEINTFTQIVPIENGTNPDTHEAYNIIIYNLPSKDIKTKKQITELNPIVPNKFIIEYDNQKYLYNLIPIENKITEFTIATLFKDDFYQIPLFYNYYKKQGVTKFILYYNGNIKKVYHLLFKAPDIEYNSWNIDYYMDEVVSWENSTAFKNRTGASNINHAQTSFLSMMRYKYFEDTRYLLLIDLDEYLHIPNKRLIDYLKETNKKIYQVKNYWAKIDNKIVDTTKPTHKYHFNINSLANITTEKDPSLYESSDKSTSFFERTKMIYRNDATLNYKGTEIDIASFNIHVPRPWVDNLYTKVSPFLDDNIKMYQFINLDDRNRDSLWSSNPKLKINLLN
jgi:hypothetical protein